MIFRDNGDKAGQVEPFTTQKPLGSENPVDLWKWMTAYEEKTGGKVPAIAHDGNLSNGRMFPIVEAFGKKIDRAYAEERIKWECLNEVTQTKGVPMGGDLRDAPEGKVPAFLVAALKDPIGANLDRIQVVKGWLNSNGEVHEQVYDVVWSDDDQRRPDSNGKVPSEGSTVDVENATWTNTIGDPELITVWKDPDFDAKQHAFYYARVIEIPTPRWAAYDAKRLGVKPLPGTTMTLQERAYTSPIWYTP